MAFLHLKKNHFFHCLNLEFSKVWLIHLENFLGSFMKGENFASKRKGGVFFLQRKQKSWKGDSSVTVFSVTCIKCICLYNDIDFYSSYNYKNN